MRVLSGASGSPKDAHNTLLTVVRVAQRPVMTGAPSGGIRGPSSRGHSLSVQGGAVTGSPLLTVRSARSYKAENGLDVDSARLVDPWEGADDAAAGAAATASEEAGHAELFTAGGGG